MKQLLLAILVIAILAGTDAARGRQGAAAAVTLAAEGDFAGLVDIGGGRQLYLECRGQGSPTVVLEAGYRSSARYWSDDLLQPATPRTMVLAGVAGFTRVCAYDRPGTIAPLDDDVQVSRSDAVAQLRTAPRHCGRPAHLAPCRRCARPLCARRSLAGGALRAALKYLSR